MLSYLIHHLRAVSLKIEEFVSFRDLQIYRVMLGACKMEERIRMTRVVADVIIKPLPMLLQRSQEVYWERIAQMLMMLNKKSRVKMRKHLNQWT